MPQRVEERIRPITPQLAWRVAVLGGVAFVLFGIVFFRLWYLQVLTGQEAVTQARDNRVRKVRIEAPRGNIVDRYNVPLVRTKAAAVVQMVPSQLPDSVREDADTYRKNLSAAENDRLKAQDTYDQFVRQLKDDGRKNTKAETKERALLKKQAAKARPVAVPVVRPAETDLIALYKRMGKVLGITPKTIHKRVIRGIADAPYSNVTIRTDVPRPEFNYMREYAEQFKGVVVEERFLRSYPQEEHAAQIFGRVFEIGPEQFKLDKYAGVAQGTRVGQSGLEQRYDKYLLGTDGYQKVVVDALGRRDDQRVASVKDPQQGQRLKLTLDFNLQKAGDEALQKAIAASQYGARAGAYVAMDPRDGSILAMGSQPSFDATVFARPFTEKTWQSLTSKATGEPLVNRATDSLYPIGSVFKPITALAALDSGLIKANDKVFDDGHYELGPQKYQNAKGASFGPISMSDALKVSSDVFFYKLGEQADSKGPVIQKWAKRLGFGRTTGIDTGGEQPGLVPDSKWRNEAYAKYSDCAKKNHVQERTGDALYKCGGVERTWTTGDNVNLAVGQGDLQATPLQVAVAYSALENGGTIVKPHLGQAIEDGNGVTVQELPVKKGKKIKIDPQDRAVVLDGLHRAATEQGGTSADVFKGFPKTYTDNLYGKTGTVERQPNPDQAWYACFVKDGSKPIVVVVTVERGGFGAETAAPAARLILSQWFDVKNREFKSGSNQSN
ncbi:MAG TPA: penicillin-binding transpeptidase domain-containing protein [Solirubrobacter sp.]